MDIVEINAHIIQVRTRINARSAEIMRMQESQKKDREFMRFLTLEKAKEMNRMREEPKIVNS